MRPSLLTSHRPTVEPDGWDARRVVVARGIVDAAMMRFPGLVEHALDRAAERAQWKVDESILEDLHVVARATRWYVLPHRDPAAALDTEEPTLGVGWSVTRQQLITLGEGRRIVSPVVVEHEALTIPTGRPAQPMSDVVDYDRTDRPWTAQPPPEGGEGSPIHDLVIDDLNEMYDPLRAFATSSPFARRVTADLEQRKAFGLRKHGRPLQARNGRDPVADAYEEAQDLACYYRQAIAEGVTELTDDYHVILRQLVRLRRILTERAITAKAKSGAAMTASSDTAVA